MNRPELTANILDRLHRLRTRPATVIPFREDELPYESLAIYIYAYLDGIGHAIGKSVGSNFQRWHNLALKATTPAPWHSHIRYTHKQASEKELCDLFLDDVELYFKQNPNWQQDEDLPLRIWVSDEEE